MVTGTMDRATTSDMVKAMTARRMMPAPVDMVHLARQTFGSADLEREVLRLFVQQGAGLVARIAEAEPGERGSIVHRLKGSARAIGATRVARITEALEAPGLVDVEARRLIVELGEAVGDVETFILGIL